MNIMPKVHKLQEMACSGIETYLTGRPIITGYGWCTIDASKFLQVRLRSIMDSFQKYLKLHNMPISVLKNSTELIDFMKYIHIEDCNKNCFVSFDFKDLYTNILFEDAEKTLRELAVILDITRGEIELILDLYNFCNEWNYFNVGTNLYRQVKGISMGCYFSKEISDLVLLYSEYKYFLVYNNSLVRFLRRYADDGIILFSVNETNYILKEISKLMLFYPSNLVVTIKINRVTCEFLDLRLSIDDLTVSTGMIHYRTFFKKFFKKFAYINPTSNHAKHVFKGLIRTECLRYIRNSLTKEDYMTSVGLFYKRLRMEI